MTATPHYWCPKCEEELNANETTRVRLPHTQADRRTRHGFKHYKCGAIITVRVTGIRCKDHDEGKNRLGYLEWHDKAAISARKGQKQEQCDECGWWFFPWERK